MLLLLILFQCTVENEELVQHLGAAKDAQRQLTAEVSNNQDLKTGLFFCLVTFYFHIRIIIFIKK